MQGNRKRSRELRAERDRQGFPLSCRWQKNRSNKSSSLQEPRTLVCIWWHPSLSEALAGPGVGTSWVTSLRADVTKMSSSQHTNPVCTKDGTMCVILPPAPSGVLPGVDTHPGGAKPESGDKLGPGTAAGNIWEFSSSCNFSLHLQMSPPGRG